MSYRVDLVKKYWHPRTHKQISEAKAKAYNKRAKKKIIAQAWLVVRHTVGSPDVYTKEQLKLQKKLAGRVLYSARLTSRASVLKLTDLREKRIREILASHRVFSKLYDDFEVAGDIQRRGAIRIAISGMSDGRRIREIIHLAFHRSIWELSFSNRELAYESFKDWLVGVILSNLRRRGLRTSNKKQSDFRIEGMLKNREGMLGMLELSTTPKKKAEWIKRIAWATDAIRQQKKAKHLTSVTLKIEKLL